MQGARKVTEIAQAWAEQEQVFGDTGRAEQVYQCFLFSLVIGFLTSKGASGRWCCTPRTLYHTCKGTSSVLGRATQGMHSSSLNIKSRVQRVLLLSHDQATQRISLRHYSIHTAPSGVTKGIKSVVAGTALPALAQLGDISELLLKSGYGSVRTLVLAILARPWWLLC